MRKRHFPALVTALFIVLAAIPFNVFADSYTIRYNVESETEPVSNPHKGWVQYSYSPWYFESGELGIRSNPTWELASTVYCRFMWKNIETSEGVYDWSKIDEMIRLCEENGKTFAFGICPSDSGQDCEEGFVPEYVYRGGCKSVTAVTSSFYGSDGIQRTPVWDDPRYLKAAYALAEALAKKYDGDKRIEYIDIRSLGNWGEWHTYGLEGSVMPSDAVQKQCLDKWAGLFKSTRLVLPVNGEQPTEVSKYAVTKGITLRRDGLVGLENHEKALLPAYENGLPAVGETCYGYGYMADNGTWTDDKLTKSITGGKVTYMALGSDVSDGLRMYKERTELIKSLQNKIGYNLEVVSAELTVQGRKSTLNVRIRNTGVAPQYFPIKLRVAFTDKNGEVYQTAKKDFAIKSGGFLPDRTMVFKYSFDNEKIADNAYISVGLFEDAGESTPDIKWCNKNTAENNYLVLGRAEKTP